MPDSGPSACSASICLHLRKTFLALAARRAVLAAARSRVRVGSMPLGSRSLIGGQYAVRKKARNFNHRCTQMHTDGTLAADAARLARWPCVPPCTRVTSSGSIGVHLCASVVEISYLIAFRPAALVFPVGARQVASQPRGDRGRSENHWSSEAQMMPRTQCLRRPSRGHSLSTKTDGSGYGRQTGENHG